jgi:outer membrane protein
MNRLFVVVLGALVLMSLGIAQQRTLTLNQAIDIALDRNFSVKQAQNNVERDQASVLAAYGNFMPNVNLNSSWGGSQGETFLPDGQRLPSTNVRSLSSSMSASMTLFDGFSNTSSLNAAVSTSVSTEQTLGRTRQNVVNQARRLYYEVLRTERLLKVAEQSLQYSTQQLERVKETARLGSASLVNVYQQQAQVGSDEVRVVQAQNDYENAKANLVAFLALDVAESITVQDPSIPEEIDQADFEQQKELTKNFRAMVETALDKRLDLMSAKAGYEATESAVTIARSGYFPRVSASASYSLSGNSRIQSEFDDFRNSRNFNWSLSVQVPLFSGFRTNEATQRALVTRKNAEENLRETERRIQVELKSALLQIEFAEKNYESSLKNLQYQEQNLKVNQERYNVGSGTLLDLFFAQNNYNNALAVKINAVIQYLGAKSQLEFALGTIRH